MKKLITISAFLVAAMPLITSQANAQKFQVGTINYEVTGDAKAAVTRSPNASGDIEIPATVAWDGINYEVNGVGESSFYECTGLTSVKIPESVEYVDKMAFFNCRSLKSVTLPGTLTCISEYLLRGCSSLESIEIPESVTSIGRHAFNDCVSLTSLTIPESVTEIDSYAFAFCTGIETIALPASITSLTSGIFSDCFSLKSLEIPENVTEIGHWAFHNCGSLEQIHFGSKLRKIGSLALMDCGNLQEIQIDATTPPDAYDDSFCTYIKTNVTLPAGSLDLYKSHEVWGKFSSISENQTSHTDITSAPAESVYVDPSNKIIVNDVAKGDRIYIYAADGSKVNEFVSQGEINIIEISGSGIFIVKTPTTSVKIRL